MSASKSRPPYVSLAIFCLALAVGLAMTHRLHSAQSPQTKVEPMEKLGTLTDIAFYDDTGTRVRLSDFRGQPVVLNLWATWCGPCVEEMPSLNRLQKDFPDVVVIALSLDKGGDKTIRAFYAEQGFENLKVFSDPSMKAMASLGVPGLPATFLIDADGNEMGAVNGGLDWDSKSARDAVAALSRSRGDRDPSGPLPVRRLAPTEIEPRLIKAAGGER